jgi:hypothetical protein
MDQPIACIILRGTANDWYYLPFLMAFVVVGVVAGYWRFFLQWLNGIRGRDWTVVPAVVDIVSAVPQTDDRGHIIGYLATLTYFYRNPELQMGEYSRMFGEQEEAQTWTASYKGDTVMVHVDPHDLSRSVLRTEEL